MLTADSVGAAMKVQYFGDKHDFFKYRLLLRLGGTGLPIGHFWMLTPPDSGGDGNHDIPDRDTLNLQPDEVRLFEFLRAHRVNRDHGFREFQSSGLLPDVKFFDEELPTCGGAERETLIGRCLSYFSDRDVIFFDPDNGLEVTTVPYHQSGSEKYVFLTELRLFFDHGKSLIIYQHRPQRQNFEQVIDSKMAILEKYFPKKNIFFAYHTKDVFSIFITQPHHEIINVVRPHDKIIKFDLFSSIINEKSKKPMVANENAQNFCCPHCNKIIKFSISAGTS